MRFSLPFSKCFSSSSSSSSSPRVSINKDKQEILQTVNAFTYNELKTATNGFRSSNKIGEGAFGTVYKGVLQDGKLVAIKLLSAKSKQGDREFTSEIASLSSINHENLVKLHGGCVDGGSRILVYEYLDKNSLSQALNGSKEKRGKLKWETRRKISIGIAIGLAHIHEHVRPCVVHRDIKASNILLDQNFTPKVSDFGLSKLFPENMTHISTRVAGTLGYLAPEYAVTGHLTRKSDVYSFGVLLLEIVSGRPSVDFDVELGEHFLVEKAWEMHKSNRLVELVDPMLKGDFDEVEAIRFIKVALLCVQEVRGVRPKMSLVAKMMSEETNIDNTQISQPGVLKDITDVKIGQRSSSQSLMGTSSPLYQF